LTTQLIFRFGSGLISSLLHWPRKLSFRPWERHFRYNPQNLQLCFPQKTVEGRLQQWFFWVTLHLTQYQEACRAAGKSPQVPFHNGLWGNVNFVWVD
jgi:predicted HicB family RNase H-like nuclease